VPVWLTSSAMTRLESAKAYWAISKGTPCLACFSPDPIRIWPWSYTQYIEGGPEKQYRDKCADMAVPRPVDSAHNTVRGSDLPVSALLCLPDQSAEKIDRQICRTPPSSWMGSPASLK